MNYIQLTCNIESDQLELIQQLLTQELADRGFESFSETETGLIAWIPENQFDDSNLRTIDFFNQMNLGKVQYAWELIEDKNWNEEWEKNFEPVLIANRCYLRAPFHDKNTNVEFDIVMTPKMAFGTGHHETTSLMIEQMLQLDFIEKKVLDMGCGTGVLAIMASMLGANEILAIDIDQWSFNSTVENSEMNQIENIKPLLGDIDLINGKQFDIILANINRNILLNQIPSYSKSMNSNGILLLSGIYVEDIEIISEMCQKYNFKKIEFHEKKNWVTVLFIKN